MSDERSPLLQNRPQNEYTTPEASDDSAIEQQVQDPPQKSHLVFVGTESLDPSCGLTLSTTSPGNTNGGRYLSHRNGPNDYRLLYVFP